jgi:hypothetical protein
MVINERVANDDLSFGVGVFGVPRTAEARLVSVAPPKLGTPPVVTPPTPIDPPFPLVGERFVQPNCTRNSEQSTV